MTAPSQRQMPRSRPTISEVETLSARLAAAVHVLHTQFEHGYGSLTGPQFNSARSLPARFRLTVERHVCDALRLIEGEGVEAFLDFPNDDSQIDDPDARPIGLTIHRQRKEPVTVPLTWPGRGMKSLRFEAVPPISHRASAVMLGAQDAGEALTQTVCQFVAVAVLSLRDAGDKPEVACV